MSNYYNLLIFAIIFIFNSNLSFASDSSNFNEYTNGVIHIKFNQINWNELKLKNKNTFVSFSSSTLIIKTKYCDQVHIPIRVIYDSKSLRNSLNSYYVIKPNTVTYLKIFNYTLSTNNEKHKFNRIEIDETFANCFSGFTFSPESTNIFLLKSDINVQNNNFKNNNTKFLLNETPFFFDTIFSNNLKYDNKDSSYNFKSLIRPNNLDISINELVNICNPVNLITKFESEVLGRPIVCGVTSELANSHFYKLRKDESINFRGKVIAGSFSLYVKRKNGGIVKVINLNNGNFNGKFLALEDGEYNIYLSNNHIIYNYPFLYFKLFMSHSKF